MQTDNELEQLLRKAPAPAAPFGLEQRLIQQVGRARRTEQPAWTWFSIFQERSWASALALFAVMAGLLTALAFQQNTLTALKEAQKEVADQLARSAAQPQTQAENRLEREFQLLQKESAELQALRAEMGEIEKLLAQQPQLAAQNAALRAELSGLTKNNPEASPEMQAALAEARERAMRIKCVNNLKNVGLAARIWASDSGDKFLPKDFATMKNELSTPKILICPSDPGRALAQATDNWDQFATVGGSYEMMSPGISEEQPSAVYVRCPFHNNVTRVDGSVHQLRPEQQIIQRNGNWEVSE